MKLQPEGQAKIIKENERCFLFKKEKRREKEK